MRAGVHACKYLLSDILKLRLAILYSDKENKSHYKYNDSLIDHKDKNKEENNL